jgi:hypothetical protein
MRRITALVACVLINSNVAAASECWITKTRFIWTGQYSFERKTWIKTIDDWDSGDGVTIQSCDRNGFCQLSYWQHWYIVKRDLARKAKRGTTCVLSYKYQKQPS